LTLLDDSLEAMSEMSETMTATLIVEKPHGAELLRLAQSVIEGPPGFLTLEITGLRNRILGATVRALPYVEVVSPNDFIVDVRQHVEAVLVAHGNTTCL
jgi:hypothetical protein